MRETGLRLGLRFLRIFVVIDHNANDGRRDCGVFLANAPDFEQFSLRGNVSTVARAAQLERSANNAFHNVKRQTVEILELDTAASRIEALPLIFVAGSGVLFSVVNNEGSFMRLDGEDRTIEFIECKAEAHAFAYASSGAANHAADSCHCNAPVVGQALKVAADRRGCRDHYISPKKTIGR